MRVILILDVLMSLSYIWDAVSAFVHRWFLYKSSITFLEQLYAGKGHEMLDLYLTISECSLYRPYLLLQLVGRQWTSFLILVLGFERFLFVAYPLWFNSIRVRRGPIILFTLMFSTMSAAIGYTNSLLMAPDELVYYICELTWSFGDNYGWCESFFIIVPQALGVLLNAYAGWVTSRNSAILLFGNNHSRLNSEKRKIRKTKPLLIANAFFYCIPEMGSILLRLFSRWELNTLKHFNAQIFLLKAIANLILYQVMCRRGRGLFYSVCFF